jgi:hypothetical protein
MDLEAFAKVFRQRHDKAVLMSMIEAQAKNKLGVCWLQTHFNLAKADIGFTLDQISDLYLHTTGQNATISEIEEWLDETEIHATSSFKQSIGMATTPLICQTHRHLSVMLPSKRVSLWHPLTQGALTAQNLRNVLVREQLILFNEASKMDFINPWKKLQSKGFDEIHEDVAQVCMKQELKLENTIA